MTTRKADVIPRKSKAALALLVENKSYELGGRLEVIRDEADSILASENPTKRQKKVLRDAANSLIILQKSTSGNIPDLVLAKCSKYSIFWRGKIRCVTMDVKHHIAGVVTYASVRV